MTELDRACAIVAAKDRTPLRVAMFRQLASQSPLLRAVLAAWERVRGTPAATGMVAGLAAKCFGEVRVPTDGDLLAIAKYRNEGRQFDDLQALVPELGVARVALEPTALADPRSWGALPGAGLTEAWERIDRVAREGDFLVAARVASTVGYALRLRAALAEHPARAVLVSSDTNPYAVAMLAVAREQGRKTCFITHGHLGEGPPPLDVDLALLDGEVAREIYGRAGAIRGQVVLRGSEGTAGPMDASGLRAGVTTLGVFLSILVDWDEVGRQLTRLRAAFQPDLVLLRLHPNLAMRDPDWATHLDLDGVEVSDGGRVLTDDAAGCDLVAIGNSSSHLSVLKAGVPTVYVPELDLVERDYYRFLAEGIATASLDPTELAAFYEDPEWPARFTRFDAAYPDHQSRCDAAVADAFRRLVSP